MELELTLGRLAFGGQLFNDNVLIHGLSRAVITLFIDRIEVFILETRLLLRAVFICHDLLSDLWFGQFL